MSTVRKVSTTTPPASNCKTSVSHYIVQCALSSLSSCLWIKAILRLPGLQVTWRKIQFAVNTLNWCTTQQPSTRSYVGVTKFILSHSCQRKHKRNQDLDYCDSSYVFMTVTASIEMLVPGSTIYLWVQKLSQLLHCSRIEKSLESLNCCKTLFVATMSRVFVPFGCQKSQNVELLVTDTTSNYVQATDQTTRIHLRFTHS